MMIKDSDSIRKRIHDPILGREKIKNKEGVIRLEKEL